MPYFKPGVAAPNSTAFSAGPRAARDPHFGGSFTPALEIKISMTDQHLTDTRFADLGLAPPLLRGLQDLGLEHCTPIQAKALPLALEGKDVAGQAQTGTGKSAAFLLAAMHHLLTFSPRRDEDVPRHPRVLIVAPTRELAIQIHKDALAIGRHTGLRCTVVYGGTGYESQRRTLEEGVDILIGTPGRLIDYFKQKVFGLSGIEVVVLDEADRMFDLGFISDIRYLLRRMPPADARMNFLFSATLSHRVHELAYEHMNGPQSVEIEAEAITADRVTQSLYHVGSHEKIPLLLGLLGRIDDARVLIFVNTRRGAETVAAYLLGNDVDTAVLSGDIPQSKRERLLTRFQEGKLPVLVATDVAARGLHIPDVSHVINYDLPTDAEDYVHRIGRTARAGAAGDAVSFGCEHYVYSLPEIEDFIGTRIHVEPIDDDLLLDPKPPKRLERARKDRNAGERRSRRPTRPPKGPAETGKENRAVAPQKSDGANPPHNEAERKPRRKRRRRARGSALGPKGDPGPAGPGSPRDD